LNKDKMQEKENNPIPTVFIDYFEGNRDYQEDYYTVVSHDNKTLLIVSDGMGGHSSGDVASRMVVEQLVESFSRNSGFEKIIGDGIENARLKMVEFGKNMGATFVAAMVEKKANRFYVALSWIGDSRIYALTSSNRSLEKAREIGYAGDNKKLWLLTEDDSIIWGYLLQNEITIDQLTENPMKNQLEYSVHPDKIEVAEKAVLRIRRFTLEPGEKLLLCSDGVWESFPMQVDITTFLEKDNIKKALSPYLEKAITEGRCSDNATYVAATMDEDLFDQNGSPTESLEKKKQKNPFLRGIFGR
jgi:serine/threonine protein phosphatase PrpC